jgi:hypothetical protein
MTLREIPAGRPRTSAGASTAVAIAIGAATAFATGVASLLVAVLVVGGDQAVMNSMGIALACGALATPIAWLWTRRRGAERS